MQSIKHKVVTLYPGIQLKHYGTQSILFHAGTGDTILLNTHATALVKRLQTFASPVLVAELIDTLVLDQSGEPDSAGSDEIESMLAGLFSQEVVNLL